MTSKLQGAKIKNNIKSERQTLKTILNQEYGWFKSDTTPDAETTGKITIQDHLGRDR